MRYYPLFSLYSRKKKIDFFLESIPKSSAILEIGCGDGWLKTYCAKNGYRAYVSLDYRPPADITGDIRQWQKLGLQENFFDIIIAFEVIEHVDCFQACHRLLKPGGQLMITTVLPYMDWLSKFLESIGLCQKRTSPHTNLVYLKDIPYFSKKDISIVYGIAQWAVFTK
jgi:2-polyprenyl-3-methyl-5-hydroxy-6-metoxy-1,4-benzoquinol methylase